MQGNGCIGLLLCRELLNNINKLASKRMFDRAIIETDSFLNVSMSAKALYFLLGMEADDEGFVSPNRVIRLYGGEIGDIKNLIDVGLIIPFQSGVVVITDWKQNNWLDERRIKPTQYQDEKQLLSLTDNKKYVLSKRLANAKPEEYSIEEKRGEENSSEHSSQIPVLIDLFKEINPSYKKWFGNKTQRSACERLIKTHGIEKLEKIIKLLPQTNTTQYCPVITTPLQLEDKFAQLATALQKIKNNQTYIL